MDARFLTFIRRHHVMTLATAGAAVWPWVAHVFYAWSPELECFVFTTDPATRHGGEMIENQHVAAGIALETRIVGRIRGVQIQGVVRQVEGGERGDGAGSGERGEERAKKAYFKRFPYAAAAPDLTLWLLEPTLMKLTDNTLGFGKKLIWTKDD